MLSKLACPALLVTVLAKKPTELLIGTSPQRVLGHGTTSHHIQLQDDTYRSICDATAGYPASCNGRKVDNTCCTDSPGGHFLQTQFWDADEDPQGPTDSFTIHGLWPDLCDGTWEEYCEKQWPRGGTRKIAPILKSFNRTDLLDFMDTYWKGLRTDEELWYHEWAKHGTCMSSLKPDCFLDDLEDERTVVYFARTVELFKSLPTYEWLAEAGITPSKDKTYDYEELQAALSGKHGSEVTLNCINKGTQLKEIWYHYRTEGGVVDGSFIPAKPIGPKSTCRRTGIKYLPKVY